MEWVDFGMDMDITLKRASKKWSTNELRTFSIQIFDRPIFAI